MGTNTECPLGPDSDLLLQLILQRAKLSLQNPSAQGGPPIYTTFLPPQFCQALVNPDYTASQAWTHQNFHSSVPLPSPGRCPYTLGTPFEITVNSAERLEVLTAPASSPSCYILSDSGPSTSFCGSAIPICPMLSPTRDAMATSVLKEPLFISLLGHPSSRRQQWWKFQPAKPASLSRKATRISLSLAGVGGGEEKSGKMGMI